MGKVCTSNCGCNDKGKHQGGEIIPTFDNDGTPKPQTIQIENKFHSEQLEHYMKALKENGLNTYDTVHIPKDLTLESEKFAQNPML